MSVDISRLIGLLEQDLDDDVSEPLQEDGDAPSPTREASTKSLIKRGLKPLDRTPSGAKSAEAEPDAGGSSGLDLTLPKTVADAAKKGLDLRRRREALKASGEIGSSESLGGTDIGVARAVQLSDGGTITLSAVKRMAAYFARHEVDKKADGFGDDTKPSAGYVAWLLWGGDPAVEWTRKILRKADREGAVTEAVLDRINRAKPIRGKGKAIANIFSANDVTISITLDLDDLRNLLRKYEVEIEAADLKKANEQSNVYRVLLKYDPKGPKS
jgi:ribosomal protein L25 (general stress protein Ctc)